MFARLAIPLSTAWGLRFEPSYATQLHEVSLYSLISAKRNTYKLLICGKRRRNFVNFIPKNVKNFPKSFFYLIDNERLHIYMRLATTCSLVEKIESCFPLVLFFYELLPHIMRLDKK